jgi:hypothetical protein
LASVSILTVPHGASKGQEQVASFHMVGGLLQSKEERVLVELAGERAPLPPMTVLSWVCEFVFPRTIEQTLEKMPFLGWTSRQETSCAGKDTVKNSARNAESEPMGKPFS